MNNILIKMSLIIIALLVAVTASAEWNTFISKDEMTGDKRCFASSASVEPKEKMGFPYNDITAWLGIGCDGHDEWAYIGFSEAPNLLDTEITNGYNSIRTRIKWDDQVEEVTLSQKWGAKFLHFTDSKSTIARIAQSNTVLLELNWYSEGKIYFRFSLAGSSAAISEMRSTCSKK